MVRTLQRDGRQSLGDFQVIRLPGLNGLEDFLSLFRLFVVQTRQRQVQFGLDPRGPQLYTPVKCLGSFRKLISYQSEVTQAEPDFGVLRLDFEELSAHL